MKNFIVITSIFEPTEAVLKFSKFNDYELIVIGDKKSPKSWYCENALFLSVDAQQQLDFELAELLPYNHYCRKMLGYLVAIQNGAKTIYDTDDDNIPYDYWSFPLFDGSFDNINDVSGFVNIYQLFTEQFIWPRGLPLHLIKTDFNLSHKIQKGDFVVGIWQGLADEDPDVDAIYRLTSDVPCFFNRRPPVVMGQGTFSPFNSQNTLFRKELFVLMYLPTFVTFRFTDILRGLVAQPIMWLYNYNLGFTNASVVQKRNPHDYFKDFKSEIPMFLHGELVISLVTKAISSDLTIEDNLYRAYVALYENHIVTKNELTTLRAWINDIQRLSL
jgi:hypothetical protein